MTIKFYTYLWLREDGTPYYVGKGKGKRAFRQGCPSIQIVEGFIDEPDMKRIILQEWPSEEDAFAAEKFLISYYGRKDVGTGILINLTDGGEGVAGCDRSYEWRKHQSEVMTGRTPSEEIRRKMSEWQIGKTLSEETKEKISDKAKLRSTNHMNTPEARAKKSEKLKGRVFSEETLQKMREAVIKRNSPNPMLGRKHSEETKRKISEAAIARNRGSL